jgi:hypothetical protein
MIALLDPLHLEYRDGNANLILWLCDALDMEYSFRAVLSEIEKVLDGPNFIAYTLPPETPGEDFIDGSARWESRTYSIYFERMLGYMQFSSPELDHVRALHDSLVPHCSKRSTTGSLANEA